MPDLGEIAKTFDLTVVGNANDHVDRVNSLNDQSVGGIGWIKDENYLSQALQGTFLVGANLDLPDKPAVNFLVTTDSPRLVFSKILKEYFNPGYDFYLKNEVDKHRSNPDITVGDNTFIGTNVTIGKGTVIFPNVVIEANTVVGENCVIKSHVSLGTEGLGLELNPETGLLEKFPQIGNVELEDYVEIGPNSTVRRGALVTTIVRKGTKIGSMTNVGHNCDIGENCILTSAIVISGSSVVGNNCFIGVNSAIRNGVSVGSDVMVGMGAIVVKDVPDGATVFGNPAKIKGT